MRVLPSPSQPLFEGDGTLKALGKLGAFLVILTFAALETHLSPSNYPHHRHTLR